MLVFDVLLLSFCLVRPGLVCATISIVWTGKLSQVSALGEGREGKGCVDGRETWHGKHANGRVVWHAGKTTTGNSEIKFTVYFFPRPCILLR